MSVADRIAAIDRPALIARHAFRHFADDRGRMMDWASVPTAQRPLPRPVERQCPLGQQTTT